MKEIPLTQGQVARVSDQDYADLTKHKWSAYWNAGCRTFYARRTSRGRHVYMHRQILGAQAGQMVDHIDHCGLHNERENIRVCTQSQNNSNQRKTPRGVTSRYKGVSWDPHRGKWRAVITLNGRQTFLGRFASQHAAARAYDTAARQCFGVFALFNVTNVDTGERVTVQGDVFSAIARQRGET